MRRSATQIRRQVWLRAQQFAQPNELMNPEAVVLGVIAPVDVNALGTLRRVVCLYIDLARFTFKIAPLTPIDRSAHVSAAAIMRHPFGAGLAASAQLGVPAAVASLGLSQHILSRPVATAIVAAAVASLGVCTLGVGALLRTSAPAPTVAGAGS